MLKPLTTDFCLWICHFSLSLRYIVRFRLGLSTVDTSTHCHTACCTYRYLILEIRTTSWYIFTATVLHTATAIANPIDTVTTSILTCLTTVREMVTASFTETKWATMSHVMPVFTKPYKSNHSNYSKDNWTYDHQFWIYKIKDVCALFLFNSI